MSGFSIFNRLDLMLKRIIQRNLSGFWMNALTFSGIIALYSFICQIALPSSINSVFASFIFKISVIAALFFMLSYLVWKIISREWPLLLKRVLKNFHFPILLLF